MIEHLEIKKKKGNGNNGLLGSHFLKLILIIIFENKDNTIYVFFEKYFYSLNLVFSIFLILFVFLHKKL